MKNLRFAVLGAARIARTIIPGIQASSGAEVVAVASRDEEKARELADSFGVPRCLSGYQAAIDDPEVDAVYIPLPPSMHEEWTVKAATAGKHVLCEKPLATNAAQARRMVEFCRQKRVVLLDGVMWYHTNRAQRIREVMNGGLLGDVRQMTSVFTFRWDEMPMDNLRMHKNMGGGSLLDLGWYCVGAGLFLLDTMPTQVQATAQWQNNVDIRMNAFLWFPENRMLTIECGFDTVRRRWFEIAGSRGSLMCEDFTRPWNPAGPQFHTRDNDGNVDEHLVLHKPQEECMTEAFCQLVADGEYNHMWGDLSLRTQQVCDRLEESARSRMIVTLD